MTYWILFVVCAITITSNIEFKKFPLDVGCWMWTCAFGLCFLFVCIVCFFNLKQKRKEVQRPGCGVLMWHVRVGGDCAVLLATCHLPLSLSSTSTVGSGSSAFHLHLQWRYPRLWFVCVWRRTFLFIYERSICHLVLAIKQDLGLHHANIAQVLTASTLIGSGVRGPISGTSCAA